MGSTLAKICKQFIKDRVSSPTQSASNDNAISASNSAINTPYPSNFYPPIPAASDVPPMDVDVQKAATWQPSEFHLARPDVRIDERRRFHAVKSSPYPLPADLMEQDRLELQHILFKNVFGKLFHFPINTDSNFKVLDIGCGPGYWTLDFAKVFPNAEVHGVDMAESLFDGIDVPNNVTFTAGNVLERLPYPDHTFDAVYQRYLALGIPKSRWNDVIREIIRVLKPGGYMELAEPSKSDTHMGPITKKLRTGVLTAIHSREMEFEMGSLLPQVMKSAGVSVINQVTRSFPIGWGGRIGDLQIVNTRGRYLSLEPFLIKVFRIAKEEYEEIVEKSLAECVEYKTYYNSTVVVGKTPET